MTHIYIDGKKFKANLQDNVLKTCLSLGFNIPYFCWHPILGSIGSCRLCAIKTFDNKDDIHGKIMMSCMTPITHDLILSIHDEEIIYFRKKIIELLMINHPHDCPICEEGGQCHLQDMTIMTGHYKRRFAFKKRTFNNQYLGPFITHNMNRCITCYRCIRYYKEYAGGNDFGVFGTHDNIYFGKIHEGTLESEFSGNLVDICPTGVFSDKTYSNHYVRKWDMQYAPSICQQCCIGCNISPGERYGKVRKIENRYNNNINGYFLCDLGRFGYEYVNLNTRPTVPIYKKHNIHNNYTLKNKFITLNKTQAIKTAVNMFKSSNKFVGIGSPRASIESNFYLQKLVGKNNFFISTSKTEQNNVSLMINILKNSGIYTPSLEEIETYDAILILGEDITQTAARMALSIRQSAKNIQNNFNHYNIPSWHSSAITNITQNKKNPIFITNIDKTKLDDIAQWTYYASVDDQARLGFSIAYSIDTDAPIVQDFDIFLNKNIQIIKHSLLLSKKPLIISGYSSGSTEIISAAANIALSLKKHKKNVGISYIFPQSNSFGISIIENKNLDHALDFIEHKNIDGLIILENNLYRNAFPDRINNIINNKIKHLIIIDHICNPLHKKANLILPSTSFIESNGTVINYEGRAQRFFKVFDPNYYNNNKIIYDSWRWIHDIYSMLIKNSIQLITFDQVINLIINDFPDLKNIKNTTPHANFRINGKKFSRMPIRYSGYTSMHAHKNIHEPSFPKDTDTIFNFSMDGNYLIKNNQEKHSKNIAFAWTPGWNSPQIWNKFTNIQKNNNNDFLKNIKTRIIISKYNKFNYFNNIPKKFKPSHNYWKIAPYWHLFGSEETSQLSPTINNHSIKPYAMFNIQDANRLNFKNGTIISFVCNNLSLCLPVKISKHLSLGQIGLPLGFSGIPVILSGLIIKNLKIINI